MNSSKSPSSLPTQNKTRTLKDYFGLFWRGLLMGSADIVPGVSGGTIAFIVGIYEELIESIRTIGSPPFLRAVVTLNFKEAFHLFNWRFLLALGAGIATAVLSLAKILEWLLTNQPVYVWSFFFGLVVASVVTVSKKVKNWNPIIFAWFIIGTIGAYWLVGAVPTQTPNTWWFYILSGAIAICAMILPGISGSFILVLLGKYHTILQAVSNFEFGTLFLVAIGCVFGLLLFSHVLSWLFKHYHDPTVTLLIGFMLGSLRKVWPWKEDLAWATDEAGQFILHHGAKIVTEQRNIIPSNGTQIAFALVLAVLGFTLVWLLERYVIDEEI